MAPAIKDFSKQAFASAGREDDLLLALPFDKLQRLALEARVQAIGGAQTEASAT